MNKIIMTKGLPGSGKTTWAKQYIKDSKVKTKRVNKDDLRAMLDDGKWTRDNEKFILETRNRMVTAAIDQGYDVIVDDTNLHEKHEHLLNLIAIERKVSFEVKEFDVPPHICIDRDEKRANSVGRKVIYDMYERFVCKDGIIDEDKPYCVIIDIDGTLAQMNGRGPHDLDKVDTDGVDESIKALYEMIPEHISVIIMSGRDSRVREKTEVWLQNNDISYESLFMRAEGDTRKDYVIKKELYEAAIKPHYNVLFAIDDRQQIVDMWRKEGIKCLQVGYGLF